MQLTTDQVRQLEMYGMLDWVDLVGNRNLRQMLTGDLVQEYDGIAGTLQCLFSSNQIDDEGAGALVLALAGQQREIAEELHRREFVSRTAPAKMTALMPDDVVNAVKERASIVDVAERLGMELEKIGSRYRASCPFHKEEAASLILYPQTNTFFCFGCRAGGDVIELLKKSKGISFREATKRLAEYYNIPFPEKDFSKRAKGIAKKGK